MFNKKLLAASMVAAVSVGMATQANAMKMQENNLGQLLLSPIYLASGGINTDIIIVNTRTDAAVKAKIVFREAINSSEVLDFILYLSPGDVWRGSVTGEMSDAFMESTDDSMTDAGGEFASEDNPVKQKFYDKEDSGSNGFGHFEVIGAYSVTVGTTSVTAVTDDTKPVTVKQGMDKRDLKAVFDKIYEADGLKSVIGPGTAVASSVDPVHLQMMGEVQVVTGDNALFNFEIPALGPDGYDGRYAEMDGYFPYGLVITNELYDASFGADSLIGIDMASYGDNISEIETAIASKDTSFEYNVDNSDVVAPIVSFVTKYRHRGDEDAHGSTPGCSSGYGDLESGEVGNYSAPFKNTKIGEAIYKLTSYDNSENSEEKSTNQFSGTDVPELELPHEVNILNPDYFSTSGWANIEWIPREHCNYDGMPALSATLKTKGATFLWTENGDRRQGM